jgi:hypothetical protein
MLVQAVTLSLYSVLHSSLVVEWFKSGFSVIQSSPYQWWASELWLREDVGGCDCGICVEWLG